MIQGKLRSLDLPSFVVLPHLSKFPILHVSEHNF